jgi:hypothetical protein
MSITTWTRLEPDIQTNQPALDLDQGAAARLADPLWVLGRQWQMGELTGEDAASPVSAHISAASFLIDSLQIGSRRVSYSAEVVAAEAEVEHDGAPADVRTRAAGGASLMERLAEAKLAPYASRLLQQYPLDGLAPDGDRILADLDAGSLSGKLSVTAKDGKDFDETLENWAEWYRPRARQGVNAAWIPDRLEYSFTATARVAEGQLTLTAPEHTGDRLDWDSFTAGTPGAATGTAPKPVPSKVDVAPTLLQIPGMPVLTFWEIEDPRFDPGRIEAAPTDTARLLLIEAALSYSADWFLMPLRLPVASLTQIDSLQVTDTFGVITIIRPVEQIRPHPGWRLWRVSDLPYLLLPPPSTGFLEADPVEQVAMVRDEAANLAWALQRVPQVPLPPPSQPAAGQGDLLYIPMTPLPDDRIPMPLTETDAGRWLVRGRLTGQSTGPSGILLAPDFRLRDEELPDEGLLLDRRYELGRTPDGVLHLWVSRVKRIGARLPASGLTFDAMQ